LRPADTTAVPIIEIVQSLTREGVRKGSALERALVNAGQHDLLTYHPPPEYPPGWRGTAVDGDPAAYAERTGQDWRSWSPEPFDYWPPKGAD
jgi:hypothetical protein